MYVCFVAVVRLLLCSDFAFRLEEMYVYNIEGLLRRKGMKVQNRLAQAHDIIKNESVRNLVESKVSICPCSIDKTICTEVLEIMV